VGKLSICGEELLGHSESFLSFPEHFQSVTKNEDLPCEQLQIFGKQALLSQTYQPEGPNF
jgi:hypothetical protein